MAWEQFQTPFQVYPDTWKFKDETGNYVKQQWKQINGKWYVFADNGEMIRDWFWNGYFWFHLNTDGSMTTEGWANIDGDWYRFNSEGHMQLGWQQIDGGWYYLEHSSGRAEKMWYKSADTNWYYLSPGNQTVDGVFFKECQALENVWLEEAGKWYWFKTAGTMARSETIVIRGVSRTFNSDGSCVNPN